MKFRFLFLFAACLNAITLFCQTPDEDSRNIKDLPLYYLDSVITTKAGLEKIDPADVANIFVYKGKDALNIPGNIEKKNKVVFIETKKFAQKRYWNYFKSKSQEYVKVVPSPDDDRMIQYILNNRLLKSDYEGELSGVNDWNFQSIEILPKDSLMAKYGIYRKNFGVHIRVKEPESYKQQEEEKKNQEQVKQVN